VAKWCALFLGVAGYMLAVWYYAWAFAPVTSEVGRALLWDMCVGCMSITGLHSSTLRIALLVFCPINGAIYAAVAFVAAKFVFPRRGGGSVH
jgi:hypothetical protein